MSEHADRAAQGVVGSFTDPAHRLAAAQVHATLAVAEALGAIWDQLDRIEMTVRDGLSNVSLNVGGRR